MKSIPIVLSIAALAASPLAAAETLEIDPSKSKVTFKIMNKPPGASDFQEVDGSFGKFSGSISLDKADASKSSVTMEVQTASVDTANKKRDDHLRNQDFFKVKEFPKMTFKSTMVSKGSDGNYTVKGDFTLLGETKPIEITFVPSGDTGGKASFQIKRSDYGMDYRVPDTADEVDVTLEIAGK